MCFKNKIVGVLSKYDIPMQRRGQLKYSCLRLTIIYFEYDQIIPTVPSNESAGTPLWAFVIVGVIAAIVIIVVIVIFLVFRQRSKMI